MQERKREIDGETETPFRCNDPDGDVKTSSLSGNGEPRALMWFTGVAV